MRRPLFHDTADAAKRLQMEEEVRVIEALPAVRELLQLPASSNVKTGYQAMLWCHAGREHGGCGKRLEPPVFVTQSRTTLLACLQELRKRLGQRHGGDCVAAAEAARAAEEAKKAKHGMALARRASPRALLLPAGRMCSLSPLSVLPVSLTEPHTARLS